MTRTLDTMTKDERSLLLFFETGATDQRGLIHVRHMNTDDFTIAKEWHEEGFVKFGRMKMKDMDRLHTPKSHWIILSDEAWVLAHQERRARAKRMGSYGKDGLVKAKSENSTTERK